MESVNWNDLLGNIKKYPNIARTFDKRWLKKEYQSKRERKHPILRILQGDRLYSKKALEFLNSCIATSLEIARKDPKGKDKIHNIVSKLKNYESFWETLIELEWIYYMQHKGPGLIIEPTFPKKGADFSSKIKRRVVTFEVRTLKLSDIERNEDNQTDDIFKRIRKIKSNLHIMVNIQRKLIDKELFRLVRLIKNKIKEFMKMNIKRPVSVYYFSDEDIQDWHGYNGLNRPKDVYINMEKYPLFFRERDAKAVMIFFPSEKYWGETVLSCFHGVKTMTDDKRIRNAIKSKLGQLKTMGPSVIVFDVSYCRAGEIDMANALYGTLVFRVVFEKKTGKPIKQYTTRENDGLLQPKRNTRISAVVMYVRHFRNDDKIFIRRIVFPNPYSKHPLSEDEIKVLGIPITELKEEDMN